VRRSRWDLMVRRMLLVVVVLEIGFGFDELPFVRLRIEIGVYGVRGIRDASASQLELWRGLTRRTFPPK
jgi:hypothetical protein